MPNNDDILDLLNEIENKSRRDNSEETSEEFAVPEVKDDFPMAETFADALKDYGTGTSAEDDTFENNEQDVLVQVNRSETPLGTPVSDFTRKLRMNTPERKPAVKRPTAKPLAQPITDEEDNEPQKSSHSVRKPPKRRRKKKPRNRLPGVLILTTLIFAIAISLAMVIIAFGKDMLGIGKGDDMHIINITENMTTVEIAEMLKDKGIIQSPKFFTLFARLRKTEDVYIAGEYFLQPNMAYETIITKLTTVEGVGKESVQIMFREGITLYEAAAMLEEKGICNADDFIFYFNKGDFKFEFEQRLTGFSSQKFYRMEGYLFPNTHFMFTDTKPEEVCQKIYQDFNRQISGKCSFDETKTRYERMEELGLTLDKLITLASIVQAEAPDAKSMWYIASVFWNRLEDTSGGFQLLQSDPTRKYADEVIRPHMQVYDKGIIDAYNTYVGKGLPPGAICNPGIEAIDAVLAKTPSEYYFFNANINTKETLFAKTLDEHNKNLETVKQQYKDAEAAQKAAEKEAAKNAN